MVSTSKYKQLKNNLSEFSLPEIITYIPSPDKNDYIRGYIRRYFIQRANDVKGYIYEISSNSFTEYSISPHFTVIMIHWRISGTTEQISDSNSKSIKIGMESIPSLHLYLPNTLQFSKQ
jgi:hypothetical protein